MAKKSITKEELQKRMGYILLGFFAYYLVGPIRDWVNTEVQVNPIAVGIVGIIFTLYFFEF